MSQLRLPIDGRVDLVFCLYPVEVDLNRALEATMQQMRTDGYGPRTPPLRVVPLEDRAAYTEALQLAKAKMTREVGPAWLVGGDRSSAALAGGELAHVGVKQRGTGRVVFLRLRILQWLVN